MFAACTYEEIEKSEKQVEISMINGSVSRETDRQTKRIPKGKKLGRIAAAVDAPGSEGTCPERKETPIAETTEGGIRTGERKSCRCGGRSFPKTTE